MLHSAGSCNTQQLPRPRVYAELRIRRTSSATQVKEEATYLLCFSTSFTFPQLTVHSCKQTRAVVRNTQKSDSTCGTKCCNAVQVFLGKHGTIKRLPAMLLCLQNAPEKIFAKDAPIIPCRRPVTDSQVFIPSSNLLPRLQEHTCRIRQAMFESAWLFQIASHIHSLLPEQIRGNFRHVTG